MGWLDNLRNMKKASGLTTNEIAAQSGLPEPTLEKLFAGITKDPKLSTLNVLVHFFGYTLDDLVKSPETEKSPGAEETAPRDEREAEIISLVRRLDDDQKDMILLMLEGAAAKKR